MASELIYRSCPLCERKDSKVKYERNYELSELHEDFFSARRDRRKAVYDHNTFLTCNNCGLVYVSPILNPDTVERLYKASKFTYGDEEKNLMKSYGRLLRKAEKYIVKKDKILDIGCGNGFLLHEALRQGYIEVYGVEPSKHAVELSDVNIRDKIIVNTLKDNQFDPEFFDVLCIFHILDHIIEPNDFLRVCWRYLKRNGIIICVTHNIKALSAIVQGEKSLIFDIEHTQLFDKNSIEKIFIRNRFRVLEVFSVSNTYTLNYWLKISPVPLQIKFGLQRFLKSVGLLNKNITIKPGNICLIAMK